MAFSDELSSVIPRRDPTTGADSGDELRLVSAIAAPKYVARILKDAANERLLARFVRLKAASPSTRPLRSPTLKDLVAEWASGDTAIIVRLRDGEPIRIVFLERETKTRVRTKFVIGGIDKDWTIHRALFRAGIRKEVASTTDRTLARRLIDRGYSEQALNEYSFQIPREL